MIYTLPAALFLLAVTAVYGQDVLHGRVDYTATCAKIESAISSASAVFYPGSAGYEADIYHYSSSSSQASACSVEPGTSKDLSTIIKIIGECWTPFAVKGGGHASNPGFSSTPGVQIAMSRFSKVKYDAHSGTAEIGAGLNWYEVYDALDAYNVTVVGGRSASVGVAGSTLGGGYSFLSNQYGLASDNVVAFEVVLPSGAIVVATPHAYSDLFWALRGAGQVNFGIVTKFTMKTYGMGQVYGGYMAFNPTAIEAVAAAVFNFTIFNSDPKADILPSFIFTSLDNQSIPLPEVILFYDGPTPPAGLFDAFLGLPFVLFNISTRSYASLIASAPDSAVAGLRAATNSVPLLSLSPTLLGQVINQTLFWGAQTAAHPSPFISITPEPFLPSAFQHSDGGAYPHGPKNLLQPLYLFYTWELPTDDAFWIAAIKESTEIIMAQAIEEGQPLYGEDAIVYSNYALADTPVTSLYGTNLPALHRIHLKYDPHDVMGLTGGFKV